MDVNLSTSNNIYPVGRSDNRVGRGDATPGFFVGRSDELLLVRIYYFLLALSLLPTAVLS